MQGDSSRSSSRTPSAPDDCGPAPATWEAAPHDHTHWANAEAGPAGASAKQRLARLARAIETDVIPRLVQAHRTAPDRPVPTPPQLGAASVQTFMGEILNGTEATVAARIAGLREQGVSVESLYLDLFGPTARELGLLWEEDLCDFSTVTVALGRLQRLLRELSPAFGSEIEHPTHGRRALFVQPRDEQHSFGLSMVAEFFRRDGWDVLGGVGGAVTDPAAKVRDEWVDIIGFSVGSDARLPWLTESIRLVRNGARNRDLVVLVGGPPFTLRPELAAEVGADGTARDGKQAPVLAERLLAKGRALK